MGTELYADDLLSIGEPDELRAFARSVFDQLYRAGEGYSLGGAYTSPDDLVDVIEGDLVVTTGIPDGVAVYRIPDGRAVIVSRVGTDVMGVDLLPRAAADEMTRPGGRLMVDQEYEDLQLEAELYTVRHGLPDPLDRVLAGPESDGTGPPRVAPTLEDTEPTDAAAETVRRLIEERATTRRS